MADPNLPPTPPASLETFDPETVLSKLTVDEKIGLLSGINPFLYSNFPALSMSGQDFADFSRCRFLAYKSYT